ncbi:MAG: 6-hydroxymethylpterin diphosphokinase MptE-like protein [Candidatus Scalindua sp.]
MALSNLKGKYSGEKCVILGNGPSLKLELIQRIHSANVFSFVANGFCLIFHKTEFQPDAVCMSNYDAIRKFGTQYSQHTFKFFKFGWHEKTRIKENIENVFELPFSCSHEEGKHSAPFIKDANFTLDPEKENFCGDTVLLDFAIPVAFYMGFTEMYLCGVDCDYSKGYFSAKYSISAKKNFRGMVNNDYSIAIPSYRYVKGFLFSHGRRIYKVTESKRLDFIETCTLEDAFGVGE